jgi:hypothetical protein
MDELLKNLTAANEQGNISAFNSAIVRYLLDSANDTANPNIVKKAIYLVADLLKF